MKYSFIIPVYNRPDEVKELLSSLCLQTLQDFEIIIVEDGSTRPCETIVYEYANRLQIQYFFKENSGPGQSRNYGVNHAQGEYIIILDSDIVLPKDYLTAVEQSLQETPCDAFGGPDRAHKDFTPVQKAINYAMTSFFTTGGIRGGKKKMDKFYPRSFNMGIKREVYLQLHGFSDMRFGEDIDFSTRLFKGGYIVRLFPKAWVWHKRRTDFKKFFKQVHNSGIARIHLTKRHPGTLKVVHLLPSIFTIFCGFFLIGSLFCGWSLLPLILFALIIFIDASIHNHSIYVGLLSIIASFVQLLGYGTGFIRAAWNAYILKNKEFTAFKDNFYD